jgi:hypothetical protein
MANISKQANQSYKHIANKKHTTLRATQSNFKPGAVGAVESAQAPKLTTGCRFSPMSCRPKKI